MLEREHFIACERLVKFLNNYSSVMEIQLAGVHSSINEAVNEIMDSVTSMAMQTESSKKEAESTLDATYLAPTAETQEMVESIQGSVDDIFEQAMKGEIAVDDAIAVDTDKLRRLAGHFSKHMESMSTMDEAVNDLLMEVMGALSNGDVISQRIEHLSRSLNALKVGLSYVLVDLNKRFTSSHMHHLREDLNDYILRQYSSEEERKLHEKLIPPAA